MKVAGQDPSLAVSAVDLKIREMACQLSSFPMEFWVFYQGSKYYGRADESLTSQEIFPLFPMGRDVWRCKWIV